ncbi:helix-turn-helix domain-containing protein [Arthrobacter agilis]|uniref:helix-turn-helix transcriptional regulator n=1 Tax=Arthrobacter agilis TaxID=37921 RepID=UPI000B34C734|nr:helix-turn-helix transcriptional regulator [Arthrobacter agilis]OUM42904.1 transcriptional regulator [Arthrobacter agilis]PPB45849.1 XRE family transcriptional regulator [Arthrobacter agilis]TPV25391.1 helix-turn-helix domain-containing protein [Arthrobacter agilis]VDR33125.1 Helix-turn-helix [Arthrobacter agilis]
MPADRSQLGAFLRARRDGLTPTAAGMQPFPGPRRVPGLRKEELAVLAGVSADYYSRLEQGRQANVSRSVLDALARALRLDEVERAHLFVLADPTIARRAHPTAVQQPDAGLLRLMTALDHLPALILGRRGEILATNTLLTAVLRDLPPSSSLVRFMFFDPLARERIINWEHFAATCMSALRGELGRHPEDVQLVALIDELRTGDPDAARWWADHGVQDYASAPKRILHPVAGELSFDIETVLPPRTTEQVLIIYTAQPDSPTARTLPLLASWNAVQPAAR